MFKKIIRKLDRTEDKIRSKLSKKPLLYAFIGSIGIVLIWRGVWMIADSFNISGLFSFILGIIISAFIGLFVSFFVGEKIIISGIKQEKRIDEKTTEEIIKEEQILFEMKEEIKKISEEIQKLKIKS